MLTGVNKILDRFTGLSPSCLGHDDDDDTYIMYDEVFVCLCVTKNEHFRAERLRREVRRLLGVAGRRPALA